MMIVAAWVIHCLAIATLLSAGAFAWEAGARWRGGSARGAWLAALAGSALLPWLLRLIPEEAQLPAPVAAFVFEPMILLAPAVTAAAPSWGAREAGVALWCTLSALMLLYLAVVMVRLARARRRWRAAEVDGARVWVTRNLGPAAVGVRRGMVVIPAWALELQADLRALLLLHEREHVRAGDPRMLFAGLMLVATMPWNPLLWLLLLRLRNAIELDCDARVLSSGASPERYGSLLLEVGRRRSGSALLMATFAEPRMFLEQRIRRIACWPLERRRARAVTFGVIALTLFATALSARVRIDSMQPVVEGRTTVLEALGLPGVQATVELAPLVSDTPPAVTIPANILERPVFTPMTVRPQLLNTADVQRSLVRSYPPLLRDAGIGGSPVVWFLLDTNGNPVKTQLSKSSGYPALDEAALAVAQTMRFSPALNREAKVPVWVEIPIVFTARAPADVTAEQRARMEVMARRGVTSPEPVQPPVPPVMTVRPELLNATEIARLLETRYPPLLKDAGISGIAVVWFYINEEGRVTKTLLSKSSGYPALDEAAIMLAQVMRFSPALRDGVKVPTWVELPLAFGDAVLPALGAPHPDLTRLEAVRSEGQRPRIQIPPAPGAGNPPPAAARSLSDAPTFTPMTRRPEILNVTQIQRALVRAYPPVLRDAGIGGSPVVWFFVDEDGTVVKVQLSRSSGYPALDEAALNIAREMRFSPAMNRDRTVQVWVEIPIVFTAK